MLQLCASPGKASTDIALLRMLLRLAIVSASASADLPAPGGWYLGQVLGRLLCGLVRKHHLIITHMQGARAAAEGLGAAVIQAAEAEARASAAEAKLADTQALLGVAEARFAASPSAEVAKGACQGALCNP